MKVPFRYPNGNISTKVNFHILVLCICIYSNFSVCVYMHIFMLKYIYMYITKYLKLTWRLVSAQLLYSENVFLGRSTTYN